MTHEFRLQRRAAAARRVDRALRRARLRLRGAPRRSSPRTRAAAATCGARWPRWASSACRCPPSYGGFGGGAVDAMGVMEAIGEALIVEPCLATVGLGARFVARGGTRCAEGAHRCPPSPRASCKLAFAQTEDGARYDLAHVATRGDAERRRLRARRREARRPARRAARTRSSSRRAPQGDASDARRHQPVRRRRGGARASRCAQLPDARRDARGGRCVRRRAASPRTRCSATTAARCR